MKKIVSRENAIFKTLRALATSGRERRKQSKTLLDGIHLVRAYKQQYGAPEKIIVSEQGLERAEIAAFLNAHPANEVLVLTNALFDEISPVETPGGILALIGIPSTSAPRELKQSCVVLDAVQDTGNLGALLRTAAAAGIGDALLTQGCAQAWSPRVLRAAMGAHFVLRIHEQAQPQVLLVDFPGSIIATRMDAAQSLYKTDLRAPVAWLFGNEGAGLTAEISGLAQQNVMIPMPGKMESLNVAAAAAICLFEELRQKTIEQFQGAKK